MIIKLTNLAKEHKNKPLLINASHILTMFESEVDENKAIEVVTNIYTITQQSWVVKESIEDIYKMVKGMK